MTSQPVGDDDLALRVENLSLQYKTSFETAPTVKSTLRSVLGRRRSVRTVDALSDVTFDVRRNGILGVIGANGAGKSTLLRVMAGILPPTAGRVEVYGEVSTLLALGLGFNKNLSGRENIYFGGMIAGLTRDEVTERFDDIVRFADIGDFIDMPVRTYSSGMRGRLAFAVSVHMKPDILLIDEALSAGDAAFKKKAAKKIRQLCYDAGTIVLVSHGTETIRNLSTEVILLSKGRLLAHGEPNEVVDMYEKQQGVSGESFVREDV